MEQLKKCYEGYPNKVNFINEVIKFWSLKDTKVLATAPIAESKIVDLYELYNQVTMRGGYDAVCASKRWSEVAAACGIQSMLVVFQMYQLYLLQFEKTIKYHITQNRYGAAPGQGIIAGAGPAMGTGMVAATLPTGMIPSSGYTSQQPQQPPAQQVRNRHRHRRHRQCRSRFNSNHINHSRNKYSKLVANQVPYLCHPRTPSFLLSIFNSNSNS
jgi:hypothetical protein